MSALAILQAISIGSQLLGSLGATKGGFKNYMQYKFGEEELKMKKQQFDETLALEREKLALQREELERYEQALGTLFKMLTEDEDKVINLIDSIAGGQNQNQPERSGLIKPEINLNQGVSVRNKIRQGIDDMTNNLLPKGGL